MRWIIAAFLVSVVCLAADSGAPPGSNSPPSTVDAQSQLLFLTAKVKSLAEVQALVLKQQQLILEHLDALHQQVTQLELDRTNLVPRAEWANAWRELDHWREQVDAARPTNGATAPSLPSPTAALRTNQSPVASSTLPENADDPNAALAALLRRLSSTNPTPSRSVSPDKAAPETNSSPTAPGSRSETILRTNQTPAAPGSRAEGTVTNSAFGSAIGTAVSSPSNALPVSAASTNIPPTRYDTYRVQPGDTLSKIIARWNEGLDSKSLPRVTQEEVEKANPNLNPDLIRVGQKILVPAR